MVCFWCQLVHPHLNVDMKVLFTNLLVDRLLIVPVYSHLGVILSKVAQLCVNAFAQVFKNAYFVRVFYFFQTLIILLCLHGGNRRGWRYYVIIIMQYLKNALRERLQIWNEHPLGVKEELIRFWWSLVKRSRSMWPAGIPFS